MISINQTASIRVNEGKDKLFRQKYGKYIVYLPKKLAENSMFPFEGSDTILSA